MLSRFKTYFEERCHSVSQKIDKTPHELATEELTNAHKDKIRWVFIKRSTVNIQSSATVLTGGTMISEPASLNDKRRHVARVAYRQRRSAWGRSREGAIGISEVGPVCRKAKVKASYEALASRLTFNDAMVG